MQSRPPTEQGSSSPAAAAVETGPRRGQTALRSDASSLETRARAPAALFTAWSMSEGEQMTGAGRGVAAQLRRIGATVVLMGAFVALLLQCGVGRGAVAGGTVAGGTVAGSSVAGGTEPRSAGVSVSIDARRPGAPVPRGFLGLSFELSSLHQVAQYADSGDLVALLRSLGQGVLRFGGVSADTRTAWTDPRTPRPAWASGTLEQGDLRALGRLAARSGWQVLLTIGLAHYDPRAAAREARAAKATLGQSLAGIELGNEPDAYGRHGLRTGTWTFSEYMRQVAAYRHAIAKAAPGIPLGGPDVSGSRAFARWGPREATHLHPALLTGHHYPLGCHDVQAPTIARLLSLPIRRKEDQSLERYLSVARRSGIPFRMDETNTVSCGGRPGVSDTFASALWAVDYIARAMNAGAAGINFQGNPANCHGYTPLCAPTPARLATGALRAQPEWYALLLSSALIGDRPLRSVLASTTQPNARLPNVDVTTLLAPDGALHVVVVDDDPPGSSGARVSVHVGRGFGAGRILQLTAPSPAAGAGVELGGRAVGADGVWRNPTAPSASPDRGGTIGLDLSPASAVLLTVPPRGRA